MNRLGHPKIHWALRKIGLIGLTKFDQEVKGFRFSLEEYYEFDGGNGHPSKKHCPTNCPPAVFCEFPSFRSSISSFPVFIGFYLVLL